MVTCFDALLVRHQYFAVLDNPIVSMKQFHGMKKVFIDQNLDPEIGLQNVS